MNFTVYSKENCPYCERVKKVLSILELEYQIHTLDENFTKEEFYSKFGNNSTFPKVLCDNKIIGGCVETIKFLKDQKLVQ